MPAPDLRLRASVKVEPVLEPTDDMPIEYLSEGEKKLTKRQRLYGMQSTILPLVLQRRQKKQDLRILLLSEDICVREESMRM